MDLSIFDSLNVADYPHLKEALSKCTDYNEAWDVLKTIEKDLDKNLKSLQSSVNEQELVDELHRYNEIKDMTQAVIGSLATLQGVTCAQVHHEFNLMKN